MLARVKFLNSLNKSPEEGTLNPKPLMVVAEVLTRTPPPPKCLLYRVLEPLGPYIIVGTWGVRVN